MRKLISPEVAVVAALLLGTAGTASAGGMAFGRSQAPAPLEGTWQVAITPYVCATGQAIPGSTFRSMVTFNKGGTMVESTSNPSFQAGQRGVGMGYWERTGRDSYRSVFEAFVLFTSVVTPPATPRYQRSIQRVDQGIEMLDTDHFKSSASVSFRDEAGTTISSGCMTAEGSRLE